MVCICVILLVSSAASAKQLTVKKIIQNPDIKTGDSVTIALEFDNPFNKQLPVVIQDSNILGSNGLDIQCYEYTLPDKTRSSVSYDFPIQAFSAGNFTLDPATITYTNPDSGKQESVKSEPLKISIKQGSSNSQQQGITKIYNCNGVSMQSTSISSSSSTSISISSGAGQINQANMPPQQQSPDNIQQSSQDMQNLKNEMEKQQEQHQKMQDELRGRIENNSDFKRMSEELKNLGYVPAGNDIKPESNDTGDFSYSYTKNSENASISGRMNAGKMESIVRKSPEDIQKIEQYIESNETFIQMQKKLLDKGFNLSDKKIELKDNFSSFKYTYSDPDGKNASIRGNVTYAGKIKDISLIEEPEPVPYWLLILLLAPLLGIYLYRKFKNNGKSLHLEAKKIVQADPNVEALSKLEKAIQMFNSGNRKEAYTEASSAVRIYFKLDSDNNELTSDEIIRYLNKNKDEAYVEDVRQCFMICDLVKFAKYEPNVPDFNKVVEYARKIIV